MTENQKLREASIPSAAHIATAVYEAATALYFEHSSDFKAALLAVVRNLSPDLAPKLEDGSHTEASQAWHMAEQRKAQALALPTADHIPDAGEKVADHLPNAGKMINGLTQSETDASASVSGLTAASVGERDAFEHDLSKSPFEFDMDRWPDNAPVDWPGSYKQYHVQCAWDAWQARAALSAGDAVDAQRYRLLRTKIYIDPKELILRIRDVFLTSGATLPEMLDAAIDEAIAARAAAKDQTP